MTADELRQRRQALNVSMGRFALLLGVMPLTYQNWEYGHSPVPPWVAEKVREIEATRWPKRP